MYVHIPPLQFISNNFFYHLNLFEDCKTKTAEQVVRLQRNDTTRNFVS